MKQNVGLKFYDYEYKLQMIWGTYSIKGEERYIVNDPDKDDDRVYGDLYTEESMDKVLSKQDDFLKGMEAKKQREIESEIEEKAALKAKQEEECLYGFDEGLTPMQKGKLLLTMMKKVNYIDRAGKPHYNATKKDFIISRLNDGYMPNEYNRSQTKMITSYNNACRVPSRESVEYIKHGYEMKTAVDANRTYSSSDITKTEYDFAKYLFENNVLNKEA